MKSFLFNPQNSFFFLFFFLFKLIDFSTKKCVRFFLAFQTSITLG